MLSEKEIEALKKGAYGINRQGQRVRIVSTNHKPPYSILCLVEVNGHDEYQPLRSNFTLYENEDSGLDIVGLWEEPFNLERALVGEPILLKNGLKGYILKQIDDTLIGYFDHSSPCSWELDGSHSRAADTQFDIIGMWKEPENAQANAQAQYKELPKPITEFGDLEKAWFVGSMPSCLFPAYYSSKNFNDLDVKLRLQNKQLFATEEHAQLWCDALSGKLKVAIVD
ncbi:hypothetical protein BKK56_04205 [Rodentibacter genomosp. 2]|uniref:hypothetical protein n=1 Tax=Rodentibacter genomosp. 2 TaxID=1908266 RepID=UPI00098558C0|nr:hypothetical protein BKK56_04205 [Rodentibacter genomosp. 2]